MTLNQRPQINRSSGDSGGFTGKKPLSSHELAANGNKAFEAGRFEEARTFYLQSIDATGSRSLVSTLTWEQLGDCESQLGNKEKANEYYRDAMNPLPNELWARYRKADLNDKMGNPEAAKELREEAGRIERGEEDKY